MRESDQRECLGGGPPGGHSVSTGVPPPKNPRIRGTANRSICVSDRLSGDESAKPLYPAVSSLPRRSSGQPPALFQHRLDSPLCLLPRWPGIPSVLCPTFNRQTSPRIMQDPPRQRRVLLLHLIVFLQTLFNHTDNHTVEAGFIFLRDFFDCINHGLAQVQRPVTSFALLLYVFWTERHFVSPQLIFYCNLQQKYMIEILLEFQLNFLLERAMISLR